MSILADIEFAISRWRYKTGFAASSLAPEVVQRIIEFEKERAATQERK